MVGVIEIKAGGMEREVIGEGLQGRAHARWDGSYNKVLSQVVDTSLL